MIEVNYIEDGLARIVWETDEQEHEDIVHFEDKDEVELEVLKIAVELGDQDIVIYGGEYDYLELEDVYLEAVDQAKERFEGRMRAFLEEVATHFDDTGEVFDTSAYRWELDTGKVMVSFYIPESFEYEGTFEGVGFALDAISHKGKMVGEMKPYNYTEDFWVPAWDLDALEQRFSLFTEETIHELVELVKNHE